MCIASAITPALSQPGIWHQIGSMPYQGVVELRQILDRLDALDKKMGLLECRDAEKEAFFKALNELIAAKKPRRKSKHSGV